MSSSKSKDPKASDDDDDDEDEEGLIEEDSQGKKRKPSSVEGKKKKKKKEKTNKKHKEGSGKNTKKKKKKKQPKGGSNDDDDDNDDDEDEEISNKKANRGFIDDAAVLSGSDDDSEEDSDDDNNNEYEKDGFIVDEDEEDDDEEDDAPKKRSRDETGEGLEDSDDDDDESIDSNDSDEEAQERRRKKNKIRVTKKLKRLREMDVLDEDDLDLINEARGLPTDRELKLRRELEEERLARERRVRGRDEVELSKGLFTGDSSDEDDGYGGKRGKAGKGGGDGKGGKQKMGGSAKDGKKQQRRPERYDEDGLDDFIEDDIGDQDDIRQGSGAHSSSMYGDDEAIMEGGVSEAQLNEAEEIFGTDYLDFMDGGADGNDGDPLGGDGGYGDDYDDDFEERKRRKKFRERGVGVNLGFDSDEEIQEEDSDYDDDDDDDDLFGEDDNLAGMDDKQRAEVLRLKREKKKLAREEKRRERKEKIEAKRKAMLRRAFEPVQLVENFCTEKDDAIRMTDSPERFYDWLEGENNPNVRPVPEAGEPIQIEEEEEAMWIMGKIPEIASECYSATVEALAVPKENGESDDMSTEDLAEKKERAIRESIAHALRYMRRDKLEPEFIKRYRADVVSSPAVRNNLYRIMDEDAEWERMVEARSKIETILNELNDEVRAEEDGKAGEEHLLKLKEQLTMAQQRLENTVKDEERVKVELQGLEKAKTLSADGDKEKDDDDDDLFGDDDEEEDEATKAAKEKQKASLQSHLDTITTLLQTQSEQVARLDTAYHEAEAAAAATSQGERSNLIAALSKKLCRDKLWHYRDYNEYVSSILEYRHVMDIKGYLNLIKEGNQAIREKTSTLGGATSSKSSKDKNKRSKRFDWDLYRTCVSEGLRDICYRFVLSPFRVGIKLEETHNKNGFSYERILPGDENKPDAGEPRQWMTPKIEDANPQEFASELVGSGELVLLSTARDDADWQDNPEMNDPLKGCRYVAAMELAHEPRIRRVLRAIYRSEAVITTRPTSKGLGIIDGFHEYYGLHLLRNKPVKEHFPMDAVELEKRRARLNAEEVKELDAELKLKETNSCIQYLNMLKAERSGDISIHVHLPFVGDVSDNDKPWYKCELENLGRDRQDVGKFMEALERVYFPADNDTDEWNDERRKILKMALVNYLLPQFEAETRRDLKDVSTRVGVEAAAQTLRDMAMEGPYRPSHLLGENRFIVPTGDLPIVGVCSSNDPKDGTFLAAVNGRGELTDHLAIPGGTSITSEKMREKVITFLMQTRPAAVVVGSGAGVGCKLTARRLGEVITQATERWNNRLIQGQDEDDEDFEARMQTFRLMHSNIDDDDDEVWKCNVDIVDDNVAQLFGRSVRGKKEFPDMAVNLKVAIATARWAKDPLGELAYTWSSASDAGVFGTEMLFLNIHPLQRLLPKPMLLREYERVLCDVTASVGVDLNGACTYDHLHGLLTFVPGLGPRKANNLKQSVSRIGGVVSSRKSLLAKRLMGPIVYNNSVAFLRIRATDHLQDQLLHPLDDSRCHPDVYHRNKWAIKIAVDALELGDSASNDSEDYAITALRDVMQNSRDEIERLFNATKAEWEAHYGPTFNVGAWDPREAVPAESWRDKVEELDLETFAEMIEENGNGKWLTHLTMIKWEFRLPFEDPRKPMEPPSGEKLFRLLTGESDVTLCPGKEVTGKVVKNGDFGSQVKLEGDVPGFIPLRNLADDHVEAAEDIVSVGTIVTAIITEVKMDHMCVDLSLKMEDFKKKSSQWGRPQSLPPLDDFFDREAAFKIDEEKEKERESRLRALRLTIGGSSGTKIGGDANDADGGDGTQAPRTGKVTRRACAHPAFRNASHSEVDRELKEAGDAMVGEALIRPSNRSCDSLAIHWMVRPGCIKVIEVHEEDKDTDASIGNRLIIKKEVYGSIDELLGRYIAPMNDRVEEIQHHRKFVDKLEDELDTQLYDMKKANPTGVFYFICWSESYPGYISLRFIMSRTARNHTIGISPEGFAWNGKTFNNLDKLLNEFKKNPSGARTPQHRPSSNNSALSMSSSMSTSRQSTGVRTDDTSRQSRSRWGPAAMPPVPVTASRWGNMPPPPAGPPPNFARPDGAPPNFGYRPPPPPGAPPGYRQ